MSEMKDMIVDVVEKILNDKVEKEMVDLLEENTWPQHIWDIMLENELQQVAVREEHGGAGGDYEDLFHLYRLMGKYAAPIPFVEHTFANVVLENANIHPMNELTTVYLHANPLAIVNGKVSGALHYVPWARYAKKLVTLASEQGTEFIVLLDLKDAQIKHETNVAAEPRDHVTFTDAAVVTCQSITQEQFTFLQKLQTIATICKMTGAIDRAFELSVQFSKEREQFGRPIHRFQLVQQHLATLAGEQALTAAAMENVIARLQQGEVHDEVAFARLKIEDSSRIVATSAHQVHAALGVTHEHRLHHYTRRLWAWRDEDYTGRFWKKELANKWLQSSATLWEQLTTKKQMEHI